MSRKLFSGATALAIAALLPFSAQARPLSVVKSSGTLQMLTPADFEPFNYKDGETLRGFEVELGDALAAQMGLKPVWTVRPFQRLLSDVNKESQSFDLVIASHAITSTRLKEADFSGPHYCTGGAIVTRPGGPTTAKQLERRTVSSNLGTTYHGFVKKLTFPITSLPVPNDPAAVEAVSRGQADAAITDRLFALAYLKANPTLKLQVSPLLWKESVGIAVTKGNKELKEAVNVALATLIKNGTYTKISQKYFGQDISCDRD